VQTQKGVIDRFIVKEHQTPQIGVGGDENIGDNTNNSNNVEVHTSDIDEVSDNGDNGVAANHDLNRVPFQLYIFYLRYWDGLDKNLIDTLVQKGPKRDLSIQKCPRDRLNRKFSAKLFTRVLSNGETCDREWLVYYKELDRVFCFPNTHIAYRILLTIPTTVACRTKLLKIEVA
jgi:hypothetical protein